MSGFEKSAQDMLDMIDAELERAEERVRKLKERRTVIMTWVSEEKPQGELPIKPRPHINQRKDLAEYLREVTADCKPRSNQELAHAAQSRGWNPDGAKVDLRSIHSIMMGWQKIGAVRRLNDKWIPTKKPLV